MHPLTRLAATRRALAAAAVAALTAVSAAAAPPAAASTARPAAVVAGARQAAPAVGNGCYYKFVPPSSWIEVCQNGGGSGGGGGGGGGGTLVCTTHKLTKAEIAALGLPPAPPGEQWDFVNCPALQIPIGNVILVSTGGGPPVTPQELLQIALGEITVPVLRPSTAPPLNRKALVGLPEFFWIPAGRWHPITYTVSVGPVWAKLTATPSKLTFEPGGTLTGTSCAGPGVSYNSRAAANDPCQYTYAQSSALQPGGAYQAAVTVTWVVTWTGSGGVGGTINAGLQMPYPFSLRVAEGQALVTGP